MFWCTWFAVTFSKMIIEVYPFIHFTLSGLLNLILPGGAGGPEYLASDYFQRAWLPFRCSAFRFGWSFVQRTSVLRCWIMVSECLKDKGSLSFCHTCFLWMFFRYLFVTGLVELQRECTCPIPHHTCQDTAHQLQLFLPFAWHMATWLQVQLGWIYLVVMTCSIQFNHGHK